MGKVADLWYVLSYEIINLSVFLFVRGVVVLFLMSVGGVLFFLCFYLDDESESEEDSLVLKVSIAFFTFIIILLVVCLCVF